MKDNVLSYQSIPIDIPQTSQHKVRYGTFKATDGQPITLKLYPIATLAHNLNRTSYTLRRWEAFGWIPKATFRIKKCRYYTKSQIQLLMLLTIKHDIRQNTNIGKAIPEKFVDESHELMRDLTKLILGRLSPQDMYIPNKPKEVKRA